MSEGGPADAPAHRSIGAKLLWILPVLLALAGAAYALWWWTTKDTLRYVTARVTQGNIERSINMTGALNPVVTAQVGSYVSGNIKSWTCDYNTVVKISQSCARIDPLPFQVIVDEDAADVKTAIAQLAKDRAAEVDAKLVYERDSKLVKDGIVTQETLDADKSAVDQDKAQIDLDIATIASKKAALQAAQVNLDYTNIVSPVDGMVITRYIDVGQTVVSSLQSSTLFLIGKDMRKMQVDTNVSEADVGEVRDGQRAYFTVQAYPTRTFEAKVRQIRRGPITVQNVVTYDVVLDVDNADMALFPGMTADAHIVSAERKNVLRVPLPATRFVPEGMARATRTGSGRGGGPEGGAGRGEGTHEGGTGADAMGNPNAAREGGSRGGAAGNRTGRGRQPMARLWVLRGGKLVPVRVRVGLDDGTLVEVSGDDLKVGDEIVVNAIRPNAPKVPAGDRPPGSQQGQNGARGGGFRL
jgi:HlyD family secretion protein